MSVHVEKIKSDNNSFRINDLAKHLGFKSTSWIKDNMRTGKISAFKKVGAYLHFDINHFIIWEKHLIRTLQKNSCTIKNRKELRKKWKVKIKESKQRRRD